MSEKKNIVIKVKYPSSVSASGNAKESSKVLTEWNYKRIGLALGAVFIVVMSILYFSGSDDAKENITVAQSAAPEKQADNNLLPVVKQVSEKIKPGLANAVIRAQLTKDIDKNEPVDKLKLPLKIGKKEKLGIYYFAELKGMKGKTIYHEWLLNGETVSKKKVNISSDPWRTASKQVIAYTMNNDWVVRLIDDSGNVLVEKAFNLELK